MFLSITSRERFVMSSATATPVKTDPAAASKTANGDTIVRTESVEIPTEGQVTVSLSQVDTSTFPNYRQEVDEEEIHDLFKSIKEHGQLEDCAGSFNADGSQVCMWSGGRRFEAMQRIALEKLVREYNEANGKQSTDEGFIPLGGFGFESRLNREKILQAGGDWAVKYKAALDAAQIRFFVSPVEDETDALCKSIEANKHVKPSIKDTCNLIAKLIDSGKYNGKQIAKKLNLSEAAVTTHKKVAGFADYLRELFKEGADLSGLGLEKPEDIESERQTLLTAIGEWERRIAIAKENEKRGHLAIGKSVAQEFVDAVDNKKEPMHIRGVANLLKFVTQVGDNGKPTLNPTPQIPQFRPKLADARKVGKFVEPATTTTPATEGKADGTAPTTSATAPVSNAVDINTLSKEQQAEFDKAANAITGAAQVSQAGTATPATGPAQRPALSAEDQAKVAEVNAANDGGLVDGEVNDNAGLDDESLDDLMPTDAQLQAEADAAGDAGDGTPVGGATLPSAEKVVTDGQLRNKAADGAAVSPYSVKPPEKIEQLIKLVLDGGTQETATFIDQAGYIQSALWMAGNIGLEKPNKILRDYYVIFGEQANAYVQALEQTIKDKLGDAVLAELTQLKPKYERPNLA